MDEIRCGAMQWWVGQAGVTSPYAITSTNYSDQWFDLDVTRAEVKGILEWNPSAVLVENYQHRLHKHYNWAGYGW